MLAIRAVLLLIAVFIGYQTYLVIMEPIEFARIEKKRTGEVKAMLEELRDAQKLFEKQYDVYNPSLNGLLAWIDTGSVDIRVRKDSSFMYYNKAYQKDMNKDTTFYRVIGQISVKQELYGTDNYDPYKLQYIPFTENVEWEVETNQINRNAVKLPTVQITAKLSDIYHDLIEKGEFSNFIDEEADLHIGALYEPTLSGNWK